MSQDTIAVSEMVLRDEALADYYQTKRNLALHELESGLASLANRMQRASLQLKEEREQVVLLLEYLSPVLDSLGNCYKALQEHHRVATDSHEELRKLRKLKKKLS